MSEARLDCALDLMRRMPPKNCLSNLNDLCELCPDMMNELLNIVDQPLKVRKDKQNGREYILCDYNRDGDSYRSPWSNAYDPPLDDGVLPSEKIRSLEMELNSAFEAYRDLYYEGGISSAYMWDLDTGFAGVVCIKKDVGEGEIQKGCWEAMHVIEIHEKTSRSAHYKLTSTIMLWLETTDATGDAELCGSLTRQQEIDASLSDGSTHLMNMGKLIEELENKMRSMLNDVYFGKSRQILNELRTLETSAELKNREELAEDLKKVVPKSAS
uniref:F-actin-capping protein subunit beta n=1 Tax=Panagrolaimus sp. JU765 TaxID=591449 RepID=A0AC34QY91_9BILA